MWFCGPKEKKEETPKKLKYYVPFDCSNCHYEGMAFPIDVGIRISEVQKDKQIQCSNCGCYTSFEEGINIAEKKKDDNNTR